MELRKSKNIFDIAIFLLFVSGRRTSELLSAKFINIKGSKDIGIKGILKRTDGGNDCVFTPMINKTLFFKILKEFNKLLKFTNLNTFQRTLNRKIKNILGDDIHPHVMRGMYALYMFEFRNNKNKKINTFIRDALCHQSINASLNYTGYKVRFDKDIVKRLK